MSTDEGQFTSLIADCSEIIHTDLYVYQIKRPAIHIVYDLKLGIHYVSKSKQ